MDNVVASINRVNRSSKADQIELSLKKFYATQRLPHQKEQLLAI
jgi:hypothetical protein